MLLDAIAALRADTNGKSRSADAAQALAQLRDRKLEKAALEEEIKASRRAVLVVNTLSRRGAYTYSEAKRQLKKAELMLDAFPVRHPERIHEIVLDAIAQGHKFLIIGGGDGTISSVVDHFAYTRLVFGVLPLGTANSFACTLGIPLNLAGAIDVLINGKVADVDLGKINDDYFANGSSIGMPAVVGRATPHALKKWLGRAAYALVAVNKFMHYHSFRCIVAIGNRKTCFDALDVKIASGGYQGGVLVASEANPDNGEILVHVLIVSSKWAIAREFQFGRIDVEVFCCSDLRGQPDAQLSVDRRNVHLLGNGPPIVVRIANTRGQDHSIALNLLIWKLRQ